MGVVSNGTIQEIWELIGKQLEDNRTAYVDLEAIYEFQIIDLEQAVYQLEFSGGEAIIHHQSEKEANCTLKLKEKNFRKFLLGELNSTTAFMTGKLKIDGNIGLALKLEGLLKQYDFAK